MSQFDLTDEQRQIQEMAQQFTAGATPNRREKLERAVAGFAEAGASPGAGQ